MERAWSAGDRIELGLEMPPRFTLPHPAIDAVRGCAAVERGPLVYCVEQSDLPVETRLADVEVDVTSEPLVTRSNRMAVAIPALQVQVRVLGDAAEARRWPYVTMDEHEAPAKQAKTITAIPYFTWANRGTGPMRVWLPIAREK
jgi:DUF1680 family protein